MMNVRIVSIWVVPMQHRLCSRYLDHFSTDYLAETGFWSDILSKNEVVSNWNSLDKFSL